MADRYPLLMRRIQDRYAQDRFQETEYRYDGYNVLSESGTNDTGAVLTRGDGDTLYVSRGALTELVQDVIAATVVAGSNMAVFYDDDNGTVTLRSDPPLTAIDPEVVRDIIGASLVPGSGVTINVNDAADTITLGVDSAVLLSNPDLNRVQARIQSDTTYTLGLPDAGQIVEMTSGTANVVNIPSDANFNFPIGTLIEVDQIGTGQTSFTADADVTLRAPAGLKIASQYGAANLRKRAANEWIISGLVTS